MKIQKGIFQGDAQSLLFFVIAMMPLNHIFRKCTGGYKLNKLEKNISYLIYKEDFKLFAQNEKELETLIQAVRIYSKDGMMEFGIEKCAILIIKSRKQQITEGIEGGCPRGVMVKASSKRVRTPVALLCSLSDKYP